MDRWRYAVHYCEHHECKDCYIYKKQFRYSNKRWVFWYSMLWEHSRLFRKKVINVLVTTNRGMVTKVQRQYYDGTWHWGRINGGMKAWMPLPEPYRE